MFCTQCGAELDEAARFCTKCGKPVGAVGLADVPPPLPFNSAASVSVKRLRRILAGKKVAGVCSGYAEYFSMDVTLMRLIWVALILVPPGIGVLAYLISWLVLPVSID